MLGPRDQGLTPTEVAQLARHRFEGPLTPKYAALRRLAVASKRIAASTVRRDAVQGDEQGTTDPTRSRGHHVWADAADALTEIADRIERRTTLRSQSLHADGDADNHAEMMPTLGPSSLAANATVQSFDWNEETPDTLRITVVFGAECEGPPNGVHGGLIAAIFDEICAMTQLLSGSGGMTRSLSVRYRSVTPLCAPVVYEGKLVECQRVSETKTRLRIAGKSWTQGAFSERRSCFIRQADPSRPHAECEAEFIRVAPPVTVAVTPKAKL